MSAPAPKWGTVASDPIALDDADAVFRARLALAAGVPLTSIPPTRQLGAATE